MFGALAGPGAGALRRSLGGENDAAIGAWLGALATASALLDAPALMGVVWTLPRLTLAVGRRFEAPISAGHLGWLLHRKGASLGAGRAMA